MKKIKKPYKKILILIIAIYVVYTLIVQEKANNEHLLETKESVNSTEYIENIAREKLGMYLPNERVYYDITN